MKFSTTKNSLVLLFLMVLSACATANTSSSRMDVVNGVRTEKYAVTAPLSKPEKRELNICYVGKLNWNGTAWSRQVVLYNGAQAPKTRALFDYVENLPTPDFKGENKWDDLYRMEVQCESNGGELGMFDYEANYILVERQQRLTDVRTGVGRAVVSADFLKDERVARANALRDIAEQFGLKITAETEVADYMATKDSINLKTNQKVAFHPIQGKYISNNGRKAYEYVIKGWLVK